MQDLDPIADILYRLDQLEHRQAQLLQLARVSKVWTDPLGFVDLRIEDDPPLILEKRPFLTQRQGADNTFWLPSENELGILFAPGGELGNSLFLPAIAFKDFPINPPSGDPLAQQRVLYRDGTEQKHDTDTTENTLELPKGKIHRKVGETEITITPTTLEGKVGTTRFKITTAKVDIRIGAAWAVFTSSTANINGFTIAAGTTNLIPGTNTYVPLPGGAF